MLEIFCPNCEALILDRESCPQCAWRRPVQVSGAVGDEVWRSDLRTKLNKPHCYPVVVANHYCLGTEDGHLLALDLDCGEVKWEMSLGTAVLAHALAADERCLFIGGEDINPIPRPGRALMAVDAASGAVCWQAKTEAHSLSAAAVDNGRVFFTATDGYLRCVSAADGAVIWAVSHAHWGPAPPLVREGVVCVGGREPVLYAYDTQSGELLWQHPAANWFAYPLVVDAATVYALAWDACLYALDLHTGALLWQRRGERSHGYTTPPAAADGRVYLGSRVHREENGKKVDGYALVALDGTSGNETWHIYTDKHIFTPPSVREGHVFFGANDGSLYAARAQDGHLIWQKEVTSRAVTLPQVAGDVVLFGGRDGMVHAVRWREAQVERPASPESYMASQSYDEAARAYALRRDLVTAAKVYVEELGDLPKAIKLLLRAEQFDRAAQLHLRLEQPKEAAVLFEKAGDRPRAAESWELAGEYSRARDYYQGVGDLANLARVAELAGDYLGAARIHHDLKNYKEAARLYHREGDILNEAEMYVLAGQRTRAIDLWRRADKWERLANELSKDGDPIGAARLYEQHQRPRQAADLYEQAKAFTDALRLHQSLENWDKVVTLAEVVEDFALAGEGWVRLSRYERAAQAFFEAGKRAIREDPSDEQRIADLYERACELYDDHVFDEGRAEVCRRMAKRYRHLPDLVATLSSEKGLVTNEYRELRVDVKNDGWGTARNIRVHLEGDFDIKGEIKGEDGAHARLKGLPDGKTARPLIFSVCPSSKGTAVPIQLVITYEDDRGTVYSLDRQERVAVRSDDHSGDRLGLSTPVNNYIIAGDYMTGDAQKAEGDILNDDAQKAQGHILRDQAQVGDRVEVRRTSAPAPEGGQIPYVAVRESAGPVRRCPMCNLPTADGSNHYCPDCGAPLPEPAAVSVQD